MKKHTILIIGVCVISNLSAQKILYEHLFFISNKGFWTFIYVASTSTVLLKNPR